MVMSWEAARQEEKMKNVYLGFWLSFCCVFECIVDQVLSYVKHLLPKEFIFNFHKLQRKLLATAWNQNNQDGEKWGKKMNIFNTMQTNERGEQSAPSLVHKVDKFWKP